MGTEIQPIIRGIQTVGHCQLKYKYLSSDNKLPVPYGFTFKSDAESAKKVESIDTTANGIYVAGFRLDGEFVRANPQIASSFMIPLLGGGAVALTNNNRSGTLNIRAAKVSVPGFTEGKELMIKQAFVSDAGVRIYDNSQSSEFYDLVTLAQIQQGQNGGDAYGADITIEFEFSKVVTSITFEMCTVATVDPLGLSGNDAADYNIAFNYLNWTPTITGPVQAEKPSA